MASGSSAAKPHSSLAAAAATSSNLSALPSYQALMSSLQPTSSSQRSGGPDGAVSPSLSLSPGSAAADAAAAGLSARESDENPSFLEDDAAVTAAAAAAGELESDDDKHDPPLSASFESILTRAMRLERIGRTRRASHLYMLCLERHRYEHAHQHMIATCLKRMGDICYKNKKCQAHNTRARRQLRMSNFQ